MPELTQFLKELNMKVIVVMQNDRVVGVYSHMEIAQAFAVKDFYDRYRNNGRRMEELNYRYLEFMSI